MLFERPLNEGPFDTFQQAREPFPVFQSLNDQRPFDSVYKIVEPLGGDSFGRLADGWQQEVRPDHGGLRPSEGDGTLNDVLQLADVAGPAIADQHLEGFAGQPLDGFLLRCGMPCNQTTADPRDA